MTSPERLAYFIRKEVKEVSEAVIRPFYQVDSRIIQNVLTTGVTKGCFGIAMDAMVAGRGARDLAETAIKGASKQQQQKFREAVWARNGQCPYCGGRLGPKNQNGIRECESCRRWAR